VLHYCRSSENILDSKKERLEKEIRALPSMKRKLEKEVKG